MGKLTLTQPLCCEKEWEQDGVTVLRASLTLPQCEGNSRRARRFNRCYRQFCRAYLHYCEQMLLPHAKAALQSALERSQPWEASRAAVRYTVTLETPALLSLYLDADERGFAPALTLRRSDTWSRSEGLPLPLSDFFPPRCKLRRRLLPAACASVEAQLRQGTALYREDWRRALRRSFNPRNFYLTPEGLVWYYPMYAVAPAAEGIVCFSLPYGADGPFLPGESADEKTEAPD